MYQIVKNVIERGGFELSGLLEKIDVLWVQGKLGDDQRESLASAARDRASLAPSVDVTAKLAELEARIKALEGGGSILPTAEEYEPGRWYYEGDKCLWEGMEYVCIAPAGTPCVWSPEAYPAYWTRIGEVEA